MEEEGRGEGLFVTPVCISSHSPTYINLFRTRKEGIDNDCIINHNK